MISGVGTDVIDIGRFTGLREKQGFLEQVFTRAEILRAPKGPTQDAFFAMLFATKEALLKALGCGLEKGSQWKDIQITPDGAPELSGVIGQLARKQAISKIHVTQAHSHQRAVAFVLIETTTGEEIA
jgi:holo-[acyl-carrier protein] synthase